jgi:hypothetical protein
VGGNVWIGNGVSVAVLMGFNVGVTVGRNPGKKEHPAINEKTKNEVHTCKII